MEGKRNSHNPKAFSKGYLPYTKENIIKQGFKFKGEEYGWGGGINNKRGGLFRFYNGYT